MARKDEDDELERQALERAGLSAIDRLHGSQVRQTASGFPDLRSLKRTGRVVQLPLRVHPKVKAIVMAILARDRHPSFVALFEDMVELYQRTHGPIDPALLPSEDELVRRIEIERLTRDG